MSSGSIKIAMKKWGSIQPCVWNTFITKEEEREWERERDRQIERETMVVKWIDTKAKGMKKVLTSD